VAIVTLLKMPEQPNPKKGASKKKKHHDPHRIKVWTIKSAGCLSRFDQKKKPKMPTMCK